MHASSIGSGRLSDTLLPSTLMSWQFAITKPLLALLTALPQTSGARHMGQRDRRECIGAGRT